MNEIHPDQRYLELAEKWVNGTITPEEEKEYASWYDHFSEDDIVHVPSSSGVSREDYEQKLFQLIKQRRTKIIPFRTKLIRLAGAAVIAGLLGLTAFLFIQKSGSPAITDASAKTGTNSAQTDILPGTNGATLTLADGRIVVLDTAREGHVATGDAYNVLKTDDAVSFSDLNDEDASLARINTLTTPRARQQHLILSDGTHIWLNAESSLKFPTAFTGQTREVEISGEAYFEVAKNAAKPFIVNVNGARIEVLGTHFNVMGYANEPSLQTTLVEGSVRFSKAGKELVLKPGQQSVLLKDDALKLVKDADVSSAIAWKNGKQVLNSANIQTVMRNIERWYDVDVEYSGVMPNRTFTGDLPRTANLSDIIRVFEINQIHAKLDAGNKKLIISQ